MGGNDLRSTFKIANYPNCSTFVLHKLDRPRVHIKKENPKPVSHEDVARQFVDQVEDDVGAINSNFSKLLDMVTQFLAKDYFQDLPAAQVFLNKLNRQCLEYEEGLMRV
jgi:hypothetical protein